MSLLSDSHDHHDHGHHHAPKDFNNAFIIGIILNIAFVLVEAGAGLYVNSLALLADAGHNLSDVLGLVIAWWAMRLALKPSTEKHTYGFKRASILAALFNASFLLVVTGGIAWEAIGRFRHPQELGGMMVMAVAGVGILINGATALLFMSGRKGDLNVRGAFLHMLADALVSLAVVIAGLVITFTHYFWIDALMSLIIAAVIFYGTWGLFKDSMNLALDAVPDHVDYKKVQNYLQALPGVVSLHDLHIWGMSTTEAALSVHLVMQDHLEGEDRNHFLHEVAEGLEELQIFHPTLQLESISGQNHCHQLHQSH